MNAALPSVAVARMATLAGATFAGGMISTPIGAAAAVASKDDTSSSASGMGCFIDSLYRKNAIATVAQGAPATRTSSAATAAAFIRTFANAIRVRTEVVALNSRCQADEETRAPDTSAKARKPRPAPRRGPSPRCSGALVSRLAATFGGRRRGA